MTERASRFATDLDRLHHYDVPVSVLLACALAIVTPVAIIEGGWLPWTLFVVAAVATLGVGAAALYWSLVRDLPAGDAPAANVKGT